MVVFHDCLLNYAWDSRLNAQTLWSSDCQQRSTPYQLLARLTLSERPYLACQSPSIVSWTICLTSLSSDIARALLSICVGSGGSLHDGYQDVNSFGCCNAMLSSKEACSSLSVGPGRQYFPFERVTASTRITRLLIDVWSV